jgi:O-antigen ligase
MPLLFINVKHGTNLILFITFIGSVIFLIKKNNLKDEKIIISNIGTLLIFISPILAIIISQSIKGEFYINNWDSPLRLFLCAPIFLAISQGWLVKDKNITVTESWLKFSIPISIFITLVVRIYFPSQTWHEHKTTYFVDPLTFSSYTLLFAFLTIIKLSYDFKNGDILLIIYYIVASLVAIYMSATSGSRTGWLSLPIFILIFWIILINKFKNTISYIALITLLIAIIIILKTDNHLIEKIKVGWEQLINYNANSPNEDTSIAMRISFYRMGIAYFYDRPFSGWGDLSWLADMNRSEFMIYASSLTRESPKHGFHNEIITSMVRSGIWGLMASLSLFMVVIYKALRGLKMQLTINHELISISLLIIIIHLFLAGLVTEITNLTFLSSFIGMLFSVLLGEQNYLEKNKTNNVL